MTYLVLGGTGRTGRRVLDRLHARGLPARAASRRTGFDWDDAATWPGALDGATAVYVCFSPDLAFPGVPEKMRALAALGSSLGVERFVLLSGRGEEGARRAEDALRSAGVPVTVLRCSWFQQNFSEHFLLGPVRRGALRLPAADVPEAFVDLDDVADVAVAALTAPSGGPLTDATLELTGPELLTFADVAAILAHRTGRPVTFEPVDAAGFVADVAHDGVPAEEAAPLAELFAEVLDGRNASVTGDVERVLGRPASPFAAYVARTAASGVWAPVAEVPVTEVPA
ncbi:NmrA family NAD(P)-binding protein [Nocardioides sp. CPCC 205120]|uniref:NmrA family NAD(P)-binding protein n=1 Tax=Nocardioides sp. CPCC 205120 TaxID=3406462 RepID=UPI003B50E859